MCYSRPTFEIINQTLSRAATTKTTALNTEAAIVVPKTKEVAELVESPP